MSRVPVISNNNQPLMPTKPSRARRWIKQGKAIGKFNDLGIFYVQLVDCPEDNQTQPIAVGIDPGKLFSGIGVQSSHCSAIRLGASREKAYILNRNSNVS